MASEDLTRTEYEKRFWQRWGASDATNFLGFGVDNPWLPPIETTETLLAAVDKHKQTTAYGTVWTAFLGFLHAFIMNSGTGDSLDTYWYNNNLAAGSQMYPAGVSKYYDMYSVDGAIGFLWSLLWYEICDFVGYYMLNIPLDFILDIISGLSWDGWWNIGWYYIPFGNLVVWLLQIKVQDGWVMM